MKRIIAGSLCLVVAGVTGIEALRAASISQALWLGVSLASALAGFWLLVVGLRRSGRLR